MRYEIKNPYLTSHISRLISETMEFEEFFTKKRIDMTALQKVEPGLFSEFKTHYTLMGEKSFDHTKKYWFNKLRLQFPLAVEPKTEKVKIDNPLAEQTITESLIEQTAASPKLGFVPKFKANIPKPSADTPTEVKPEEQAAAPTPKLRFTPKFKATSPPTPAGPTESVKTEVTPDATPAPKLGFTPKFKVTSPPKPLTEQAEPAKIEEETKSPPAPKLGFTPKFKATNMPKPMVEPEKPAASESTENTTPAASENPEAKPTYKPRFNIKNLPKKEEE